MRVGVDARPALFSCAGIGRYVRELIRAWGKLEPGDVELVLHAEAWRRPEPDLEEELRLAAAGALWVRSRWPGRVQRALAPLFGPGRRLGVDLYHVTDLAAPPLGATPIVVTLHDVAWRVDPAFHTEAFRRGAGRRTEALARRARRVIVPSRATRAEVSERLGLDADRVVVVPHGADHAGRTPSPEAVRSARARLAAAGVRGPFALCVGTLEPRKNHARLLDAHARARADDGVELVLVGGEGWGCAEVVERLRRGVPGVHWLGVLPDDEVLALLDAARFAVYVSLHEGFGLPVVEAMARGRAVLASRVPAIEEAAADAALLVDPRSVDAIADGLLRLARDAARRERLAAAGRARAGGMRWRDAALAHLDAYRGVLQDS